MNFIDKIIVAADYKPYLNIFNTIASLPFSIGICNSKGHLLWSDNSFPGFDIEKALKNLEKDFSWSSKTPQFQHKTLHDNAILFMINLGSHLNISWGWLALVCDRNDKGLVDKDTPCPILHDISQLIRLEYDKAYEVEDLSETIKAYFKKLDFIYSAEKSFEESKDISAAIQGFLSECTTMLGLESFSIYVPAQNLWAFHISEETGLRLSEKTLRDSSDLSLKEFQSGDADDFIARDSITELHGADPFNIIALPLKTKQENPIGVFLLIKSIDNNGLPYADRKLLEMFSKRVFKFMAFSFDPLTGLLDRIGFEAQLETAFNTIFTRNEQYSLAKVDIDQFELINDAFSFKGGDEVLRQLADLIKNYLRDNDIVARVGSDEFAILFSNASIDISSQVIERLREKINATKFTYDKHFISITVSIGILELSPEFKNIFEIEGALELACKAATTRGGNTIQVYHPDNSELAQSKDEIILARKIDTGLQEEMFELFCQPLVPLWGANYHYEILLRMIMENGEIFPPAVFMSAAEKFNRMPSIDRWVINKALKALGTNHAALDGQNICWGINLAGQSLADKSFLDFVIERISHVTFPTNWIYFEITESVAIRNIDQVREFVNTIKDLGCEFALDDFGTGYSSYEYLKKLPVNYLKIDGSFIRNLDRDPFNQLTVQSINQLSHYLGIKTVAEYAENDEIVKILRQIGVDYAQGYAYSKPLPLREVLDGLL